MDFLPTLYGHAADTQITLMPGCRAGADVQFATQRQGRESQIAQTHPPKLLVGGVVAGGSGEGERQQGWDVGSCDN